MNKKEYIFTLIVLIAFLGVSVIAQSTDSIKLNKEDIRSAGNIIGMDFTESEIDSMLQNLENQLSSYYSMRKIHLSNSLPPAIQFNPLPVGFKLPGGEDLLEIERREKVKLPDNISDLAFYSIPELAELIRTKQISSTELTKFFIERLKKYDSTLHCVISLTEERALKEAAEADKELAEGNYKGLLHGIPYGVKDLFAAKGYKTTWGAEPYKEQVIEEDAAIIEKLHDAGAVLIAKLTLGALAWGDVWFGGKTRTPWDTTKGSSGSSAGSASAVAAGLVPFAIGTETWGSIVSPSTMCGVTGLRPTYGRVSRTGAMALSWTMDKVGPICRSAEDLAIVFSAIHGQDGKDQTLYDVPFRYDGKADFKKLRIGYIKSAFERNYSFKKNDSLALQKFRELGAELIPIELPDLPVYSISFILSAEAGAAFDELTRNNEDDLMVRQIRNAWANVFRAARFIPAVEYINANRIRTMLIQQMQEIMDTIDIYLSPSWVGGNLLTTNLTGHPCVVMPTGFLENGLPTTITLIGGLFDEGKLLAAAKRYQDATKFNKLHPDWVKK